MSYRYFDEWWNGIEAQQARNQEQLQSLQDAMREKLRALTVMQALQAQGAIAPSVFYQPVQHRRQPTEPLVTPVHAAELQEWFDR